MSSLFLEKAYYFDFNGSFTQSHFIIIWLKPIPFFYFKNGLKPNPIDFK